MNNFLIKFLSSCAFLGYSPFASGTVGTLGGLFGVWLAYFFIDINSLSGKIIYLILCIILIIVSIPISTKAEIIYNKKDSSKIVIDEAVSFFITMLWINLNFKTAVAGFLLNRIFDIIKPQPAKYCQNKLPAGYGVVLDDIVSAIYSNISLRIIIFLTGKNLFF